MHLLLLSTLLFLPGIKSSNDLQTLDELNTEIVPIQEPQHERSLSAYQEKPYEKHIAKKFMNQKLLEPARELKLLLSQHDDKFNEISSDESEIVKHKSTPKYNDYSRKFEKFKEHNKNQDLVKYESKQKDQKNYDHHNNHKHENVKFLKYNSYEDEDKKSMDNKFREGHDYMKQQHHFDQHSNYFKNKDHGKYHENQHFSHNHDRSNQDQQLSHLKLKDHDRSHEDYYIKSKNQKKNYEVQHYNYKNDDRRHGGNHNTNRDHERSHNSFDVNNDGKKNNNFKGRLIEHDVSHDIRNKEKFNHRNMGDIVHDQKYILNNKENKKEMSGSEEKDNNFSKEHKNPDTGSLEEDFIKPEKKETYNMKKHAYGKKHFYENKRDEVKERKERFKRQVESDESDYSVHDGESDETTEKEVMEHSNDFDNDMIIVQDKSEEKMPVEEEAIQKTNAYVSCNGETGMCHRVKHKDVDAEEVKQTKESYRHEKAENDETWLKLLEESIKRDGIDVEYH